MADTGIIDKIEGLVGLVLMGGVAYVALKFGPRIVAAFRDAIDGLKQTGGAAVDSVVLGTSIPDVITVISDPEATPADVAGASGSVAWDIFGSVMPWTGATIGAGKAAIDMVTGAAPRTDVEKDRAAKAAKEQQKSEYKASAVRFVSGSESSRNFDANLAKKQAEWQAAQDARTAEVKLLVSEYNSALAKEREAQRIKNEEQYNAWLKSTRPAESVTSFLNAGKQYKGQQEVAPGVYVAPSGAYQVIQGGQIVAGGSAGAAQAARHKANTAMYPGTNYRREVVEAYQAKARAGDAAAAAWLKRFAPAGAV